MAGQSLAVLYECAAGYTLFSVDSFEEIGQILGNENVSDMSRFGRHVHLSAFQPFSTAQEALANSNAISEHIMTSELKSFLEMNLPGKKKKVVLCVLDPALATAISEGLDVSCRSDETVREIVRGIRMHLTTFIKDLKDGTIEQAQLGLGHSYSRLKVKFNPARSDNMIIQSIALLDQMDKDLNTFAMRVKEWYSWHFPELKDIVKDNYMFARCAAFVQDKASLCDHFREEDEDTQMKDGDDAEENKLQGLIKIVGDEDVANAIVAAAKTSMGMECSAVDMVNIVNFTQRMVKLAEYRKDLAIYLTDKMAIVAPNLSTLIGDTVAARLISKAGSLTNLAKAPASTVQILGAEKALFRALKTKGNTPKYGLIYHSTFIGRAEAKNKGRISRYLANKCSIATRIDSFSDNPTNAYGVKLREQVEERLKFYETGAQPRKNIDVMEEVAKSIKVAEGLDDEDKQSTPKKEKKKGKKRKVDQEEENDDSDEKKSSKKEKKKSKSRDKNTEDVKGEDESKALKKAAKKAKKESSTPEKSKSMPMEEVVTPVSVKSDVKEKSSKKKKKKKK